MLLRVTQCQEGYNPMTATSISVHVLRSEHDCTLNGVTSKESYFVLFASKEHADAYFNQPADDRGGIPEDALYCVRRNICGQFDYVHAEPYAPGNVGWHCMAGGNYVTTCDSRYFEVTGVRYPIAVHDRFER